MIEAIILDWGGVIEEGTDDRFYREIGKPNGITRDEFLKVVHPLEAKYDTEPDSSGFWEGIRRELDIDIPDEELIRAYNCPEKIPHVYDFIKQLAETYNVYLLSNQCADRTAHIKAHNDLSFFKETFFSSDTGMFKSSPDTFLYMLEQISVKAENALFIDNTRKWLYVAQEAGLNSLLFTTLDELKSDLNDYYIQSHAAVTY